MADRPALRKLTPEDLYGFILCGDPQISPDGEWVAFVRQHVEGEHRECQSHIWMVPAGGSAPPRPFTAGAGHDTSPRWSPDGTRLAFVRTTGDTPESRDRQIWIIPRYGGEAWQLTSMRHGADSPAWAPDGSAIAFQSDVGLEDRPEALVQAKTAADRKEEEKAARNQARVITRKNYRHDPAGMLPDRRHHVWAVPVPDIPGGAPPVPVQVTAGDYDHTGPAWSPDGTMVAVDALREPDGEYLRASDVWVFPVPGRGAPVAEPAKVTRTGGLFGGAAWSPDGSRIAVVGNRREYAGATLDRVWLYPVPWTGGEAVCLTRDWDRGVGDSVGSDLRPGGSAGLRWAPDGSTLYFYASDRGATHLFRVPAAGGPVTRLLGGEREIYGFTLDARCRRVAFVASGAHNVGDVYAADLGGGEQRLTDLNAGLNAAIAWPEVQEVEFPGHDGGQVHGWIMRPVGFRPGVRYPAVLNIHGGPHTCYGYGFYQEMHVLAAAGYAVIYVNPRGSSSYGQEFERACQGDYGGHDFLDLMDAVDHAVSLGWIDEKRLGVTGGSYGGFMTNWIIGQTERFAAAVTHRSISNWISFWGVSDIGHWFAEGEHQIAEEVGLWTDLDKLWQHSPLKYARQIRTPLLICHSEHDLRCPMEQAEQLFLALKVLKREVEFVRHPRSNHDLTRQGPPVLRVDRFHHILRWFGRHLPVVPEDYDPLP